MLLQALAHFTFILAIIPIIKTKTKLGDYMLAVDQNITEILTNPTREMAEPLIYVMDEYVTHIRDVNHVLVYNPKFMYKTAKYLYESEAPKFLNVEVDLQHLHDVFQWEEYKTELIGQYINDISNFTRRFHELFPTLNAYEFEKYDYESKEHSVDQLGNFLVDLDRQILHMLVLPEADEELKLLKSINKFWDNFIYLNGLVVLNEQEAFRPAKYLVEQECPSFLPEADAAYDLQKTFNWSVKELECFKELVTYLKTFKRKFINDFIKMKVDVATLFKQPYKES